MLRAWLAVTLSRAGNRALAAVSDTPEHVIAYPRCPFVSAFGNKGLEYAEPVVRQYRVISEPYGITVAVTADDCNVVPLLHLYAHEGRRLENVADTRWPPRLALSGRNTLSDEPSHYLMEILASEECVYHPLANRARNRILHQVPAGRVDGIRAPPDAVADAHRHVSEPDVTPAPPARVRYPLSGPGPLLGHLLTVALGVAYTVLQRLAAPGAYWCRCRRSGQ